MSNPTTCWRCPVCESPLFRQIHQWRCVNQHSFDIAKEAYVNLLLPQHKNSKMPGDSKEMVLARRAFLSQDHYLPLAKHISKSLLDEFCANNITQNHVSIFDAGCGEGYYLNSIAKHILTDKTTDTKRSYSFCGIDIAKPAVQKAARSQVLKQHSLFEFAVASSFNLPVISNSQHAVIQIFAPSKSDEIYRILKANGLWISVNPASEHLFELKNMVYDSPEKHSPETGDVHGFTLVSQQTLKFEVLLPNVTQRHNLLMMTPFYWTISQHKKQSLLANLISTHAHFDIKVFRKV
ncbi:MAG: 23S rRNA (guanine745-N1)-methyltransferase [Kangiellaceae bacterium]|jgi:23S rRNA (guanine745-N1)-methyltransferase